MLHCCQKIQVPIRMILMLSPYLNLYGLFLSLILFFFSNLAFSCFFVWRDFIRKKSLVFISYMLDTQTAVLKILFIYS